MSLHVPVIDPDADNLTAALAYADAGWYVLPVKRGTKNPGTVVGDKWQAKSSRDPRQITAWFAGTTHGIALHCGRSGAVGIDVDKPELVPDDWWLHLNTAPYQSSRPDTPRRGHYPFAMPPGRVIGNPKYPWGEVRGLNGVIIAANSQHKEHKGGGQYRWERTGPVQVLPDDIDKTLPDGNPAEDAATDEQVAAFLATHTEATRPEIMAGWIKALNNKFETGSRHVGAVSVTVGALKESRCGYLAAKTVIDTLEPMFITAATRAPTGGEHQRTEQAARDEYKGILAWAVGQALGADLDEVRKRTEEKMPNNVEFVDGTDDPTANTNNRGGGYFNKAGLRAATLLHDCEQLGPLASGIDGKVWAYIDGVWVHGDRELRARTVKLLGERYRRAHADTVESMVGAREPFINDTPATEYLNAENGLLHWRTGKLEQHTPTVPSTTRIPVRWNPDATCPNIDTFLRAVVDEACVPVLEEVAGYALYPSQPLHKAVLLDGNGRNGKGKFLLILGALLGSANFVAVPPQRLDTDRFAVAQLYGKLANLVGDVDPRTFKETAAFKQATGQDVLHGEHKYCAPFTFTSRALIVAAFNSLPRSVDTTEGFFSRWLVIPFPNRFADPDENGHVPAGCYPSDPDLEAKVITTAELEGFLVRAVEGLQRLMGRGQFSRAESITDAEREFRRHADPVRGFLAEQVIADRDGWVSRASLHAAFKDWATESGLGALSAKRFAEKVREVHVEIFGYTHAEAKRQGERGWSGIRLRISEVEPDVAGHTENKGHKGAQGAPGPIPSPTRAWDKGWEGAPCAPCAPNGQHPNDIPRRPGCVCTGQPQPCYHCKRVAERAEP